MCECLEYEDGDMYLCECCAGMWKKAQADMEAGRYVPHEELRLEFGDLQLPLTPDAKDSNANPV